MKSVTGFLLFLSVATPTTGQSCPGGWYHFGTSCYAFIDAEPLEWTEAMFYCSTLHAKLVEIETAAENAFLKSHLTSLHTSADNYWIGLTDALVEGKFVWQTTQEDAVFVDWAPLEPNDLAHIEDCGDLHSGYQFKWNDASCSSKFDFICEREIEGNPANVIG
ncbi:perlucin-like isoform X1 [Crassostrea angulata]|uniref:perlucin-like isoform X1 n=1 Tax=Magallana angulata TaxID=2784310 RepID=UPI0022B115B5|nr:perlucin-like isoform X1 [Crassostrea angulata]